MKLTLSLLITLGLTLSLNASDEFPLIQPYAVEEAPVVTEVVVAPPVVEEAPVAVEEEVAEQEETNTQDVVKADDDNDGVINEKDKCPDTSPDFMVDGYGCPQTAVLNINFPPQKATISEDSVKDLNTFAQFLKDNTGYQVIIYGYTDSIGNEVYNKSLSLKRADAVKQALMRYEIDEIRLTTIGKGEEDPIADNETEEGRAQNRRIEVELIY